VIVPQAAQKWRQGRSPGRKAGGRATRIVRDTSAKSAIGFERTFNELPNKKQGNSKNNNRENGNTYFVSLTRTARWLRSTLPLSTSSISVTSCSTGTAGNIFGDAPRAPSITMKDGFIAALCQLIACWRLTINLRPGVC
jgi:hypothetical protein